MTRTKDAFNPEIPAKAGDSDAGEHAFPAGTIYDDRPITTSPRAKQLKQSAKNKLHTSRKKKQHA